MVEVQKWGDLPQGRRRWLFAFASIGIVVASTVCAFAETPVGGSVRSNSNLPSNTVLATVTVGAGCKRWSIGGVSDPGG
jgi:hypothetical protein